MKALAPALLLIATLRHWGYDLFPVAARGAVSKALAAAAIIALVWIVYRLRPSRLLLAVCAWWTFEESQVVICSALYAWRPWEVEPGQSICSAVVGLDIGAATMVVVALLAARIMTANAFR